MSFIFSIDFSCDKIYVMSFSGEKTKKGIKIPKTVLSHLYRKYTTSN